MNYLKRFYPKRRCSVPAFAIVGGVIGFSLPLATVLISNALDEPSENSASCLTGVVFFTPILTPAFALFGGLIAATINDMID